MTDPNFKPKIVLFVHILSAILCFLPWGEKDVAAILYSTSGKKNVPIPTDMEKSSSTLIAFKIGMKFFTSGGEFVSCL